MLLLHDSESLGQVPSLQSPNLSYYMQRVGRRLERLRGVDHHSLYLADGSSEVYHATTHRLHSRVARITILQPSNDILLPAWPQACLIFRGGPASASTASPDSLWTGKMSYSFTVGGRIPTETAFSPNMLRLAPFRVCRVMTDEVALLLYSTNSFYIRYWEPSDMQPLLRLSAASLRTMRSLRVYLNVASCRLWGCSGSTDGGWPWARFPPFDRPLKLNEAAITAMRANHASLTKAAGVFEVEFQVLGLSMIMHPRNPMAPTVHMNCRYFETRWPDGSEVVPIFHQLIYSIKTLYISTRR